METLIVSIEGLGVYYTMTIIRSPQNSTGYYLGLYITLRGRGLIGFRPEVSDPKDGADPSVSNRRRQKV